MLTAMLSAHSREERKMKSPDMTPFQTFIAQSKYARWREDLGRRETWTETVDRWWGWMKRQAPQLDGRPDIRDAVHNLEVMPSMRALMTAGEAAEA